MPKRWSEQNIPAGYGICPKGSNRVIGSVDFNHRQGIMPEAARGCWKLDLIW